MSLEFPPRKESIRAFSMPLYFKPLEHGEEVICCGAIIVSETESLCVQVPGFYRFASAYGEAHAKGVLHFVKFTLEQLQKQLEEDAKKEIKKEIKKDLSELELPFTGFSLGTLRFRADDSLKGIASQVFMLYSSFCSREELDEFLKD